MHRANRHRLWKLHYPRCDLHGCTFCQPWEADGAIRLERTGVWLFVREWLFRLAPFHAVLVGDLAQHLSKVSHRAFVSARDEPLPLLDTLRFAVVSDHVDELVAALPHGMGVERRGTTLWIDDVWPIEICVRPSGSIAAFDGWTDACLDCVERVLSILSPTLGVSREREISE